MRLSTWGAAWAHRTGRVCQFHRALAEARRVVPRPAVLDRGVAYTRMAAVPLRAQAPLGRGQGRSVEVRDAATEGVPFQARLRLQPEVGRGQHRPLRVVLGREVLEDPGGLR